MKMISYWGISAYADGPLPPSEYNFRQEFS